MFLTHIKTQIIYVSNPVLLLDYCNKNSPFQRTKGSKQQCFGGNLWWIPPLIWSQKAHVWEDMFAVQLFNISTSIPPHFVVNFFALNSQMFNVFSHFQSNWQVAWSPPFSSIYSICMSIVSNPCAWYILWTTEGSNTRPFPGQPTSLRTEVRSHRSLRLGLPTTRRKTLTLRRLRWSTTALACSTGPRHVQSRIAYW